MCDPTACHQSTRCAETIPPDADPRAVTQCVCDRRADDLAALVEAGVPQREASLRLWGAA